MCDGDEVHRSPGIHLTTSGWRQSEISATINHFKCDPYLQMTSVGSLGTSRREKEVEDQLL